MTEEQKQKYEERIKKQAILAHELAKQIIDVPKTDFQEALETVQLIKENIERARDWTKATIRPEIYDVYGCIVKMP